MATIYCFTSTGNSLYAAKRIASKIGGNILPMNTVPATCDDDVIGFVFPCYYWGLPRIMARFLSELRVNKKDAYVFAVMTSGGPVSGVLGWLTKRLKARGITLSYGARLESVTNYLPEFKVNDSEKRLRKTEENLSRIIGEIKSRRTNRAAPISLINRLSYKTFPDEGSDRYFTVSERCTGCGTCGKVCPVSNVVMENGKPQFQHHCEHCLGCLHHCPAAAIDWKHKTEGKKRYRHPKVSLAELISFQTRCKEEANK